MEKDPKIVILGIGCTLIADQGFGVAVAQALSDGYRFPPSVQVVDGGLIGVALTGIMADADHVIAVDAIRNRGDVGDFYRLEGLRILDRLAGSNSVSQVEFLEALAHCQALDRPPRSVLLGVEPEDTETLACELTPAMSAKIDAMVDCVLRELDRLAVGYRKIQNAPS